MIPSEQLKEINQYHQIQDKSKRLISRTFLFKYLKDNYNLTDFTFSYTDMKRPTFKQIDIDFNISYSKDLIAIAISTKNRIGVDIEYINHSFEINNMAPVYMNNDELNIFQSLKYNKKVDYFYSLWTYKEALAKLIGGGLHLDLKELTNLEINDFDVSKYQPFVLSDYCLTIARFN